MKILAIQNSNYRFRIYLFGKRIFSHTHKKTTIYGDDNVIVVPKDSKIKVIVHGNNNHVVIEDDSLYHPNFTIFIGTPDAQTNNCNVYIGNGFSCGGGFARICEDNTTLEIGSDCMFSCDVRLWASDTHTILKNDTCINIGRHIKIGNHVWIGFGATVLKNTTIGDNCTVGTCAVVSGDFAESGLIIAGNPATVVKTNTNWDRRRPKQYIANN